MNWDAAIEMNRVALLRIVAVLFAKIGIAPGDSVATLRRPVYTAILVVLKPAESALRRLVFVVMSRLPVRQASGSVRSRKGSPAPRASGERAPVFRLIDPRKRFAILAPPRKAGHVSATWLGSGDWTPAPARLSPPTYGEPVKAASICRRLWALHHALTTLSEQARRLARLEARRKAERDRIPRRPGPLRPGRPPGYRAKSRHAVDSILDECDGLAHLAMRSPDTS